MPTEPHIILTTCVPRFTDGGDFMLCELQSDERVWKFGIPWSFTALAMPACGEAFAAHEERARNVVAFDRGPAREHG